MLSSRIAFPNPVLPTDRVLVFIHIITLINRRTADEKSLTIETLSDSFSDVMREITHQKVMQGLLGYEVWEILACQAPF